MAEPQKQQMGDGSDNIGQAAGQAAKAAKNAGKQAAKQAAKKGAENSQCRCGNRKGRCGGWQGCGRNRSRYSRRWPLGCDHLRRMGHAAYPV